MNTGIDDLITPKTTEHAEIRTEIRRLAGRPPAHRRTRCQIGSAGRVEDRNGLAINEMSASMGDVRMAPLGGAPTSACTSASNCLNSSLWLSPF